MDVQQLVERAREGQWGPVHVIVGTERFLAERAIALLRAAVVGDGPSGFNEEVFHGQGLGAASVGSAARTLPMMAQARFVLVRNADAMAASELDGLVGYLEAPSESTCLVMVADKLDGRGKFAKAAKKRKVWVDATPLKGGAIRGFAEREAKSRGHRLASEAAEALVDATGEDLAAVDDALERLSLYVGAGQPIDLASVQACVTRVRTESIWALVDAVGLRDARRAMQAASSMLAAREPPLRILAMVARQLRMVARMREAMAGGMSAQEAVKKAGAPPFKARPMAESARRFTARDLGRAFAVIAEADRALKGSKRPDDTVLQEAILRLCVSSASAGRGGRRPRA